MPLLEYVIDAPAWKTSPPKVVDADFFSIIYMNWLNTLEVVQPLFFMGFYWLILPNEVSEGGGHICKQLKGGRSTITGDIYYLFFNF